IPPAAEDSGPAIGAAYYGLWQMTRHNTLRALRADGVGRCYPRAELDAALAAVPGVSVACQGLPAVLDETVRRLAAGQLAGWFQGRSELGPRALGQRSILADPRSPDAKASLNGRVKLREAFRPFAPAIPAAAAEDWFELDGDAPESPFMLRSWPFKSAQRGRVPAVVHEDGTGRAQTVDAAGGGPFHQLLQRFGAATGVPILLNTSFNGRGEPIVETPEDALWCLLQNGLDFVVLEDRLVEKDPALRSLLDLFPALAARSYAVEIPIAGQRFSAQAPAGTDLVFRVDTRWGSREVTVPGHFHPVLWAIDGATDGWTLLEKVSAQAAKTVQPGWLNEILGRLRRSGVLALHREPLSSVRSRPEGLP
ncbi:MAG TPA: carbamoyltransferase C-terminal domain-containing protein, partial [Thermoanaerobaculia bacterium]